MEKTEKDKIKRPLFLIEETELQNKAILGAYIRRETKVVLPLFDSVKAFRRLDIKIHPLSISAI
jgi:hypothetical protein